jgi:hypothetical protein
MSRGRAKTIRDELQDAERQSSVASHYQKGFLHQRIERAYVLNSLRVGQTIECITINANAL